MHNLYKTTDVNTGLNNDFKDKKVKIFEICGHKYEVVHKDIAILNNKFSIYAGFILYLIRKTYKRVVQSSKLQKMIMLCFYILIFGLIFMWRCSDIINECIDDGYDCELLDDSDTCVKIYRDYISSDSISYRIDNLTIYQNLSNCIKNHNSDIIYQLALEETLQFFFICAVYFCVWIGFLYILGYMGDLTYKLADYITNKIYDAPSFYPDIV